MGRNRLLVDVWFLNFTDWKIAFLLKDSMKAKKASENNQPMTAELIDAKPSLSPGRGPPYAALAHRGTASSYNSKKFHTITQPS